MLTKNNIIIYMTLLGFFAVYFFHKMKIALICAVIAFLVGTSLAAASPTKPSEFF